MDGHIVAHAAQSPEHGAILADAILQSPSVRLEIPLAEIYAFADMAEPESDPAASLGN